jgi:phage-related protein
VTLSAGSVSLPVHPDTKGFGEKLASGVLGESAGIGDIGKKIGGLVTKGLAAAGIAIGIGEVFKKGFEEYSDADAINAQFRAGIQSTNNAAGLTVHGMDELAASISGYSGQAYDSIGKTEQVLQTFTNIKNVGPNKIFDDATVAAANMAAKLGGDASSSAIQLGKALNDPVKGVTALTRVGVTFTQAQKDSIAAMVKAGDTMGAQKVILKELSTEFGGAAAAAGQTLPGSLNRIHVAFGEVAKGIVSGFMPVILPALNGLASGMERLEPVAENVADLIGNKLAVAASGASRVFGVIGPVLSKTFDAVKAALGPVVASIGPAFAQLVPVFAPLIGQVLQLASAFSPFSLELRVLLPVLPQLIGTAVQLATTLGGVLGSALHALLPVITQLASLLVGQLIGVFRMLVPVVVQLANMLGPILSTVIKALVPVIVLLAQFLGKVFTMVAPLIPVVLKLVAAFIPLLVPLLALVGPILTPLIKLLTQLLTPILALATTVLGILIPPIMQLVQLFAAALPPILQAIMPIISAVGSVLTDVLTPAVSAVTQILNGLITFLTGVFTGNWNDVWSGIGQIFSGVWNGLGGIAKGAINGVIDIVNGAIKGIDSVGGAVGIHISTIPKLAQGATILPTPGGTVVRVGEGGRAESVVDTGKLNRLLDQANGSGSSFPDTITLVDANGSLLGQMAVMVQKSNNQMMSGLQAGRQNGR